MAESIVIINLKNRVIRLQEQLAEAEKELREARIAESGVRIGETVRSTGAQYKGHLFRVCQIRPQTWGRVWVIGNPRLKDGTFGKAERHLYSDWEIADAC